MKSCTLFAGVLVPLLLAYSLRADVVILKDGRRFEGKVIEKGQTVEIRKGSIKTFFERHEIARIEKKLSPAEELAERRAALDPKDADGHYELGMWCIDKRLRSKADELFETCIKIDLDHARARQMLGHVQRGGKWVLLCRECTGTGKRKCPTCAGSGIERVVCPECDKGRVPCEECDRRGYFVCETCNGRGNLRCRTCGGDGYQYPYYPYHRKCKACNGRGRVDCPQCVGGKIDCKHCKGGRAKCPACDGHGYTRQTCSRCQGAKTVPCDLCVDGGIALPPGIAAAKQQQDSAQDRPAPPPPKRKIPAPEPPPAKTIAQAGQHHGRDRIEFFGVKGGIRRPTMVQVQVQMVHIPSGEVAVSDRQGQAGRKIRVKAFLLDRTEVTNAQYTLFLMQVKAHGDRECAHPEQPPNKDHTPEHWNDPEFNQQNQPVVGLDWFDAYAFAKWVGKRLPTREEWQLAAGVDTDYPWGQEPGRHNCNHGCMRYSEKRGKQWYYTDESDGFIHSSPVSSFSADLSPFGCVDMAGNVSEWTATMQDGRACRCGGNMCQPAEHCRNNTHRFMDRSLRSFTTGFRCAKDVE